MLKYVHIVSSRKLNSYLIKFIKNRNLREVRLRSISQRQPRRNAIWKSCVSALVKTFSKLHDLQHGKFENLSSLLTTTFFFYIHKT